MTLEEAKERLSYYYRSPGPDTCGIGEVAEWLIEETERLERKLVAALAWTENKLDPYWGEHRDLVTYLENVK